MVLMDKKVDWGLITIMVGIIFLAFAGILFFDYIGSLSAGGTGHNLFLLMLTAVIGLILIIVPIYLKISKK